MQQGQKDTCSDCHRECRRQSCRLLAGYGLWMGPEWKHTFFLIRGLVCQSEGAKWYIFHGPFSSVVKVKKQRDGRGPRAVFPVFGGRIVDLGLLEAGDPMQVIFLPFWRIVLSVK